MLRFIFLSFVLALISSTCINGQAHVQVSSEGSWISYRVGANAINPSYDVRYNSNGYGVFTATQVGSTITYASTVAFCEGQGYVPITDTAPRANGNILFGTYGLTFTQAFYMDSLAYDGDTECTQQMTLTSSVTDTSYNNPCYYRYQHGIFDRYSYVTPKGNALPGSAFFAGNFQQRIVGATTSNSFSIQYLNQYNDYYWNFDSVAYPMGQLYMVGMKVSETDNVVCRMDMPPTQLSDFASRLASRVGDATNSMTNYEQLVVVCVAQSIQAVYTTSKPTEPVFVQGWKDLTWVQKHWYVPFVIIAAVILIVLLIILIVCCCKKNQDVDNRIEGAMVVRERVGKAYAYNDADEDEEMH